MAKLTVVDMVSAVSAMPMMGEQPKAKEKRVVPDCMKIMRTKNGFAVELSAREYGDNEKYVFNENDDVLDLTRDFLNS